MPISNFLYEQSRAKISVDDDLYFSWRRIENTKRRRDMYAY